VQNLLNVHEASRVLGISKSMLYELAASGQLAHVRIGARILFRPEQLEAFVESCSAPVKGG
jgi:excisionase family DNA binding protein